MLSSVLVCLVIGITDGDTIKARCGEPGAYQQVTVRLAAIDAPEHRQPFGEVSRQHLAALCFEQQPVDDSCYFDGRRYSPGALALMGQAEMACTVKDGAPAWERPAY